MSRPSIAETMAEIYLDRLSLNLSTTKDDLKHRGFNQADIDRYAARAAEIASRQLQKRQSGKAA
jgi:hypothetical protein